MKNLTLQTAPVKNEMNSLVHSSSLDFSCRTSTEMYGGDPDVDGRTIMKRKLKEIETHIVASV